MSDLPMAHGDRSRLLQVMQNLIDNAIKYMGDQPEPYVRIGYRDQQGEPVYFVEDNGMGIEPRHHEKVFDLFEQLDSEAMGSGVGLALVQRIIHLHGGRIWIESEGLGQGSAFCFTLGQAGRDL